MRFALAAAVLAVVGCGGGSDALSPESLAGEWELETIHGTVLPAERLGASGVQVNDGWLTLRADGTVTFQSNLLLTGLDWFERYEGTFRVQESSVLLDFETLTIGPSNPQTTPLTAMPTLAASVMGPTIFFFFTDRHGSDHFSFRR